jgi:glycosyltransferase involved in cell wall biosynthesis
VSVGRNPGPGHGLGRYAEGLLGALPAVAEERGGELVRAGGQVHHSLSLYDTPLFSRGCLVVTMHDVAPLQWPELYLRTGLAHRARYWAVRRAAGIVCVSSAARDDLLRHLEVDPERVWVVPEAADERFRPTDPASLGLERPYLLYVGAFDDPRKDVQGLVDAFARWAAAEGRPETLVLAGPGDASALRLGNARVSLRAFVPEADLPALYSGASCFVSASRYEGFGLGALESIACGTPVVAYDAGAIPETAGPGALLAPAGDGAALMSAVARVCDESELARRLAADGRRHAERFSWRRTAELTWDVYERVS